MTILGQAFDGFKAKPGLFVIFATSFSFRMRGGWGDFSWPGIVRPVSLIVDVPDNCTYEWHFLGIIV